MIADMSRLTCALLEAAIWLSGYYNRNHKNTKLNLGALMHNAKVIVEDYHSNLKSAQPKESGNAYYRPNAVRTYSRQVWRNKPYLANVDGRLREGYERQFGGAGGTHPAGCEH
jgi:hypothetical protein